MCCIMEIKRLGTLNLPSMSGLQGRTQSIYRLVDAARIHRHSLLFRCGSHRRNDLHHYAYSNAHKTGRPQVSQTGRKVTVAWAAAKEAAVSEASTTIFSPDRKILLFTKVLEQRSSSRRLPMMKAKVISSLRRIAVQNSGVRRLILQRTVHSSRHQVLHQFRILMEFLLCLGKQPSARMAMERSLTPFSMGMLQTDLARSQSQLAQRRLRPLRCG